jgi:murein DD-endopeptidase MepM/ murein hydrolase activator NlpD
MNRRSFLNAISLAPAATLVPSLVLGGAEANAALSTWPHIIYKEKDRILSDFEPADAESFAFNVLVRSENPKIEPQGARLKFYSSGERANVVELSKKALNAVRATSIWSAGDLDREDEVFDLRHYFSMPLSLNVDRLVYSLTVAAPGASGVEKTLEIPLLRYEQKTKLVFPMRGKFIVVAGHDFNEAHSFGRSQHFAYDIFGIGPHWEITRNGGATMADFCTWGREVIAPADGVVVYARNDVPDQARPGTVDSSLHDQLPNPGYAGAGNNVLLNHGNNEYSSLGHMRHGSVRVKTGDRVRSGDVVGLAGNSNSPIPHLHYQLTNGEHLFRADGLPSTFENVYMDLLGKPIRITTPKRGTPLEAR